MALSPPLFPNDILHSISSIIYLTLTPLPILKDGVFVSYFYPVSHPQHGAQATLPTGAQLEFILRMNLLVWPD